MRALTIVLLSLSLVACPPKKPTEEPGDAAAAPVTGDPGVAVIPAAREPITECPKEPPWMAWAPCKAKTAVYVSGKVAGVKPLSRHAAMNAARAELVRLGFGEKQEDGAVLLDQVETLDTFACNKETSALARIVGDALTEEALAQVESRCEGVVMLAEEDPEASCPDWTRRGSWREEKAIFGVGFVTGIKNAALATKTARNRALAEAQKVNAITVQVEGDEVSTRTAAAVVGVPTDVQMATCDGANYVRVKLEPLEPHAP